MSLVLSTPVTLPDSWGGFATNRGVLRFDGHTLTIEFETKDGVFEALRSGVQKVTVPLAALDSLVCKPGWFGAALELTATSMDWLEKLPGSSQGRVCLKVIRKDRAAAARLADEVGLAMAGRFAQQFDQPPDPHGEASPTAPSHG